MENTKPFHTPTQLHHRWSFHPESIRRMIRQGRLPAVRIGKRLLCRHDDVEAFEQRNRVQVAAFPTREDAT